MSWPLLTPAACLQELVIAPFFVARPSQPSPSVRKRQRLQARLTSATKLDWQSSLQRDVKGQYLNPGTADSAPGTAESAAFSSQQETGLAEHEKERRVSAGIGKSADNLLDKSAGLPSRIEAGRSESGAPEVDGLSGVGNGNLTANEGGLDQVAIVRLPSRVEDEVCGDAGSAKSASDEVAGDRLPFGVDKDVPGDAGLAKSASNEEGSLGPSPRQSSIVREADVATTRSNLNSLSSSDDDDTFDSVPSPSGSSDNVGEPPGKKLVAAILDDVFGSRKLKLAYALDSFSADFGPEELHLLLRRLAELRDWRRGLEAVRWMAKRGRGVGDRNYATLYAILGRERRLGRAVEMFEQSGERGVFSYTGLISAFARCRKHNEALDLFARMQKDGVQPNLVTYNVVLDIHAKRLSGWGVINRVFKTMKAEGIAADTCTYNTLIMAASKLGLWREARALFDEMQGAGGGCKPNRITWNSLLDAYSRAGKCEEAAKVLEEMIAAGGEPNLTSFNTLINGYNKAWRPVEAEGVLAKMAEKKVPPDVVSYTAVIQAYGKAGDLAKARGVFQKMLEGGCQPNVVTFNTLIDLHGKAGEFEEVGRLHAEMGVRGLTPSVVTWNTLLSVYSKGGRWGDALKIFRDMQATGCPPDTITYHTLIDLYGKASSPGDAARAFQKGGGVLDQAAYNALVGAYGLEGRAGDAERTVEEMREAGFEPDAFTYTALLNAYVNSERYGEAGKVLEEMRQLALPVGSHTCRVLVHGYCKGGMAEAAEKVLLQMLADSLPCDPPCWTTVVRTYAKQNCHTEARSLLDRMMALGQKADTKTLCVLTACYCRQDRPQEALAFVEDMFANGVRFADEKTFNKIMRGYGAEGKWKEAGGLLAKMEKMEVKPDTVTYNTLIGSYLRENLYEEARNVLKHMVARGVVPNEITYYTFVDIYRNMDQPKAGEGVVEGWLLGLGVGDGEVAQLPGLGEEQRHELRVRLRRRRSKTDEMLFA